MSKGKPKQKSSDKRLENLRPWKPGQSGNPKGAKPGKRWKTVISEILDLQAKLPVKGKDVGLLKLFEEKLGRRLTNRDVIIIKQIFLAQKSHQSARLIMEREEGSTEKPDKVVVNNFLDLSDDELDARVKALMAKVNEPASED
jgi:hypothetical protein